MPLAEAISLAFAVPRTAHAPACALMRQTLHWLPRAGPRWHLPHAMTPANFGAFPLASAGVWPDTGPGRGFDGSGWSRSSQPFFTSRGGFFNTATWVPFWI